MKLATPVTGRDASCALVGQDFAFLQDGAVGAGSGRWIPGFRRGTTAASPARTPTAHSNSCHGPPQPPSASDSLRRSPSPPQSATTSGPANHPTQDQRITDTLITGRITPLTSESGRELKAHIWPEQLTCWLGLSLATTGIADTILLPRITPSTSAPARIDNARSPQVTTAFVTSTTERYPDLFGFLDGSNSGTPSTRTAILDHLNRLPRYAIDLSHDHRANTELLAALSAPLIEPRLHATGPAIPHR